jgi:hypothetical protein
VSTVEVAGALGVSSASSVPFRICIDCRLPIPGNRLSAVPNARRCTPCLELAGDVPKIRRYDETLPDGDVVEIQFVHNPYIEKRIELLGYVVGMDLGVEERDRIGIICQTKPLGEAIHEQALELNRERAQGLKNYSE